MNVKVLATFCLVVPLISTLSLAACAGSTATQPTSTPEIRPTNTPLPPSATLPPTLEPTGTPTPTQTLKPTATITPDRKATQVAAATQKALDRISLIQSDLDQINLALPPGKLGWMDDFPYLLEMSDPGFYYWWPIGDDLIAKDFIFKSDVTWESTGGLMTCGLFFRAEANFTEGKQYLYSMQRLSGLPSWRIAYMNYGLVQQNITGWISADAIDQGQGATNEIILQIIDGEYTLYVNGERIGTYYDYFVNNEDGYLAFYGYQDSGESNCSFENTWIWLVEED